MLARVWLSEAQKFIFWQVDPHLRRELGVLGRRIKVAAALGLHAAHALLPLAALQLLPLLAIIVAVVIILVIDAASLLLLPLLLR